MTRNRAALILMGGSVLFYLPFAARYFLGDDWLWLATGIRTLHDPGMLLERPMYGYWRPFYSVWISLWMYLVGAHPWFYSAVSLVLHGLNAVLIYTLLLRLGATRQMAGVAAGLFAVYYLNAPVVTWIAPAHDMIVTALSLAVCLTTLNFIETRRSLWLLAATLCWLSAALTKESGFVAIAPALLLFLMYRQNPFKAPALWYTLAAVLVGVGYLMFYFTGRVYVDKALVVQPSALIYLWYLLAYLILPLSARIAAMVPSSFHPFLVAAKVIATVAVPVIAWVVWRRGDKAVRFFALWSFLFVLPVVLFDWNVSLFTLYPERTVSRFMYMSSIGTMVLLSWGLDYVWRRWCARLKWHAALFATVALLVVLINGGIIYKVTAKYRYGQSVDKQNFTTVTTAVTQSGRSYLTVVVPEMDTLPQFLADSMLIKAMALVGTGQDVSVDVRSSADSVGDDHALLWWDDTAGLLSATPINPE